MASPPCIALIADIVKSRSILGNAREVLQESLQDTLAGLNHRYAESILSQFVVTTGDEFQALLRRATVLPDLVWDLEEQLPVRVRIGVGLGALSTRLQPQAFGMDGPAWHAARAAILAAKKPERLGAVFVGFGTQNDAALNGLARLLYDFRVRLRPKQRATLGRLRRDQRQSTLAREWHLTKQAVHARVRSLRWDVYHEGETAWRSVLDQFDFSSEWEDA